MENMDTHVHKNNKNTSKKLFTIFLANITYFSKHAQEYLFALNHDSLWLVELHKEEPTEVEHIFRNNGYSCTYNPPAITDNNGTHGGEAIAFKSNYYYKANKPRWIFLVHS